MNMRRLGGPTGVVALMALIASTPVRVATQDASAGKNAREWAVPRTPWGDPDMQGTWTNQTTTPLQRQSRYAERKTLSDDEVVELQREADERGDRPPAPGDTGTSNQFWHEPTKVLARTSLIVDPPNGRLPALTPDAEKTQAARADYLRAHSADSWEDRSPWERCIGRGLPRVGSNNGSNFQIVQAPGVVVLIAEVVHETQVIPVDGRQHLPSNLRLWNGDARGRWEGHTLVVETTNFLDRPNAMLPGIQNNGFGRSARALRVVERFTITGPNDIDYQFTVHDATTFTQPWTVDLPMRRLSGPLHEYACHEGNYGLKNILSAQRAQEKAGVASERTVWDGVFTEAQTSRGEAAYRHSCATCHKEDLLGDGTAPALAGEAFFRRWNESTVDDVVQTMRSTMPQAAPNSLDAQVYVDIITYLLKASGSPTGSGELTADRDRLKLVRVTSAAPK